MPNFADFFHSCVDVVSRSGKCIAEKNIKAFYAFTSLLCFQTYYLMAVFIYYIIYLAANTPVGPQF